MSRINLFPGLGQDGTNVADTVRRLPADRFPTLPPTLVRNVPKERNLEHAAHNPAVPLTGRKSPEFAPHQHIAVPQIIVFTVAEVSDAERWFTSEPIATPSKLTNISIWTPGTADRTRLQLGLASTPVTSIQQLAACPRIFQLAPSIMSWDYPVRIHNLTGETKRMSWDMQYLISDTVRNRIVLHWNPEDDHGNFMSMSLTFQPI